MNQTYRDGILPRLRTLKDAIPAFEAALQQDNSQVFEEAEDALWAAATSLAFYISAVFTCSQDTKERMWGAIQQQLAEDTDE